jgi:hypothetical protein
MRAVFDDGARIRAMLAFEAALAEAEAETGVIPADAARAIVEACADFVPDIAALGVPPGAAGAVDPVREGADRALPRAGARLGALGRDQPGRRRHRPRASDARGNALIETDLAGARRRACRARPTAIATA